MATLCHHRGSFQIGKTFPTDIGLLVTRQGSRLDIHDGRRVFERRRMMLVDLNMASDLFGKTFSSIYRSRESAESSARRFLRQIEVWREPMIRGSDTELGEYRSHRVPYYLAALWLFEIDPIAGSVQCNRR